MANIAHFTEPMDEQNHACRCSTNHENHWQAVFWTLHLWQSNSSLGALFLRGASEAANP